MDSETLKENIESLDKVIGNLQDYMFDQGGLIDKIKTNVSDTEEDMLFLEELKYTYIKLLKEKTDEVRIDISEPNE